MKQRAGYLSYVLDPKVNPSTKPQHVLRGYGTPCNIYKDERILNYDYNHGFKNFKIYNICPKNAFINLFKRDKKQNLCEL